MLPPQLAAVDPSPLLVDFWHGLHRAVQLLCRRELGGDLVGGAEAVLLRHDRCGLPDHAAADGSIDISAHAPADTTAHAAPDNASDTAAAAIAADSSSRPDTPG